MTPMKTLATMLATLAAALSVATAAHAAPPAPAVQAEIHALLASLGGSGCQFDRNGTWYPAPQAQAHLQRKLDAVEDHGTLQSTEQFIDAAATRSSITGDPYHVKCGNEAPMESRAWLTARLAQLRAHPQPVPVPAGH